MRSRYLFMASAACLVVALVTIFSNWKGNAGFNAGSQANLWKIEFCGSATGLPAAFGLILLLAAIVLLVVGLVRIAIELP